MIKSYENKTYPGDEPRIEVTEDFVTRNNLAINFDAARALAGRDDDFFGFMASVAIPFLPKDVVYGMLNEEYREKLDSGEDEHIQITDVYEGAQDFLDYMVFAWMKAMDERGLSAGRSIEKLKAWMIILGRPDVATVLDDDNLYPPYGRPALRKACEMLGIDVPSYL